MPLLGNHLFGSDFNSAANDSEWRAAVTLWWASWNQVPAGSLPDDDAALCRLADLGRDVKTWKKLRTRALHGFTLCSDGRMYHEFLSQQALVAWDKRIKERQRKAKWRAARDGDVPPEGTGTETGTKQGQNADVPADVNGRDGTGRDGIKELERAVDAARVAEESAQHAGFTPTRGASVTLALKAFGILGNPGDLRLTALLDAGATIDEFVAAAPDAKGKDKPWQYVLGVVEGRRRDATRIGTTVHRGPMPSNAVTAASSAADTTQQYLESQKRTPEQIEASKALARLVREKLKGTVE